MLLIRTGNLLLYSLLLEDDLNNQLRINNTYNQITKDKCGNYQDFLTSSINNLDCNNIDDIIRVKKEYVECRRSINTLI